MGVNGIKANKCFESVITFRGLWSLIIPDVGQSTEKSFSMSDPAFDGANEYPCVLVSAAESYDPAALMVYGYYDPVNYAVVIGVKNVSDTSTETIDVNFVVI